MASDDKKAKATPAPKADAVAPKKAEGAAKGKTAAAVEPAKAEPAKAEAAETPAAAPSSYSRGEGQKPVSQAYKDNWNAIYGKKAKKKTAKKKTAQKKVSKKKKR